MKVMDLLVAGGAILGAMSSIPLVMFWRAAFLLAGLISFAGYYNGAGWLSLLYGIGGVWAGVAALFSVHYVNYAWRRGGKLLRKR